MILIALGQLTPDCATEVRPRLPSVAYLPNRLPL